MNNVQLLFVSVQKTAQASFRMFLKTRIIVDGANAAAMAVTAVL